MSGRGAALLGLVALLGLGPGVSAQSAIEGRITNGTSGGPGRAERVNLLRLADSMEQAASLTDVEGGFRFELSEPGPYLVQVQYQGVGYNQPVPPQGAGTASVEITVFDATTDVSALEVSIPHAILIADGSKLHVSHVFEIRNPLSPPRSIVGDPGAFRFDIPAGARVTKSSISSARMPLHQEPVETRDERGNTITYALKPGLTRFELEYELAYSGSYVFRETLYHGARELSFIVLPAELEIQAQGLEDLGMSERQGVRFRTFAGRGLAAGSSLAISMAGEARAPQPPAAAGGATDPHALEGEPQEVEPAFTRGARKYAWLGAIVGGLALLGMLLARERAPRAAAPRAERRLSPAASSLLDELARLDRSHEQGDTGETEHRARRAELKQALVEEIVQARRKRSA